jgi:hypothetical protein
MRQIDARFIEAQSYFVTPMPKLNIPKPHISQQLNIQCLLNRGIHEVCYSYERESC